jgi:hypothetical protein
MAGHRTPVLAAGVTDGAGVRFGPPPFTRTLTITGTRGGLPLIARDHESTLLWSAADQAERW